MANDKRGFTLIELLVVIAIIAVMVGVLFVAMNPATQMKKARDSNRKTDLNQIKKALYLYYNDHDNQFPDGDLPWGAEFSSGGTVYMKKVPADPSYQYDPDIPTYQDFCLSASLERASDPDGLESKERCVDTGSCAARPCINGACNYYYVCAD